MKVSPLAEKMESFVRALQNQICEALEAVDGSGKFQKVNWQRPGGGGGESRILNNGKVFEKAGVNVSAVHGDLPTSILEKMKTKESAFFATGISLVLHPHSPQIPTVHANYRYFEQPSRSWFGGGADLTPYVMSPEDFKHFHSVNQKACMAYKPEAYAQFKKACDEYFFVTHRGETRGVGGIFFDYLEDEKDKSFEFVQRAGNSFVESYLPIVERNKNKSFTDRQKKFQLLRRGRYVEFNLVYDRGTLFGLQTKGNIESILMSLPSVVNFDFMADLETNADEKELMSILRSPRDWA